MENYPAEKCQRKAIYYVKFVQNINSVMWAQTRKI